MIVAIAPVQSTVYRNLPYPEVFEHETKNKDGEATNNGTYCVSTGQFTGRSPKDKYFVQQVSVNTGTRTEQSIYLTIPPSSSRGYALVCWRYCT